MLERISFVCQSGVIEAQAVLLAASLRLHMPTVTLLAAHPWRHGVLKQSTVTALRDLDVDIVPIENPLDATYPIGHKLAAAGLLTGGGLGMFLDSDVIAMQAPHPLPNEFAAMLTGARHCPVPAWHHIYNKFDLPFPSDFTAPPGHFEPPVPYFNAGVIAVPGSMAARFATEWVDCARRIDADLAIPRIAKRPFLDQTALPIAVARLGYSITPLLAHWNFPSWAMWLPEDASAVFFHYQNIPRLARQPQTRAAARAAMALLPSVTEALSPERALGDGLVAYTIRAVLRQSRWTRFAPELIERSL